MQKIAVLTGDLIHSTDLTSAQLEIHMTSVKTALEDWADGDFDPHFTRQSGDGWQTILIPPEKALRAALHIRAWLRKKGTERDTRISIAAGCDVVPKSGNLNDATGTVFIASGRGLRALGKRSAFGHSAGGPMSATVRLADHISRGWTETQARVVLETLKIRRTQEEIAERLGLSQQSVQQSLAAAGYPALSAALEFVEGADD